MATNLIQKGQTESPSSGYTEYLLYSNEDWLLGCIPQKRWDIIWLKSSVTKMMIQLHKLFIYTYPPHPPGVNTYGCSHSIVKQVFCLCPGPWRWQDEPWNMQHRRCHTGIRAGTGIEAAGGIYHGSMQKKCNSNALAMELHLFCIEVTSLLHWIINTWSVLQYHYACWWLSTRTSAVAVTTTFGSCIYTRDQHFKV